MPLLGSHTPNTHVADQDVCTEATRPTPSRKQSQHSNIAIAAMMHESSAAEVVRYQGDREALKEPPAPQRNGDNSLAAPSIPFSQHGNGVGPALTDTPATTAPNSPRM